ncbi:MAG: sel1 repeat family protein [Actinobacteria bacterium]|nr:sel1 repeat family protein [Actinomycetota bacterium]
MRRNFVGLGLVVGVLSLVFVLWVFGKFQGESGQQEGSSEKQSILYQLFGASGSVGTTKNSDSLTFVSDSCFDLSTKFGVESKLSEVQKDEAWKGYRGKAFDWQLKIVDVSALPVVGGFLVQAKCSPRSPSLIADLQLKYGSDVKPFVMQLQVGSSIKLQGTFTETSTLFGLTADGLIDTAKAENSKAVKTEIVPEPAKVSPAASPESGFVALMAKAEKGDTDAQCELGLLYSTGKGVPQDYAKAVQWWQRAAEAGSPRGQNNLGAMYADGTGVSQDYAQAVKWYRKSADKGYSAAQYGLGTMYDQGHGVPQNYAEALRWYEKAGEQGFVQAQFNAGVMYQTGEGVEQSFKAAADWYRKAAELGDAKSQFNLGVCYENGEGVNQDSVQAYRWWNLAAAQGHVEATKNRDRLAAQMTVTQKAEAQKLAQTSSAVATKSSK